MSYCGNPLNAAASLESHLLAAALSSVEDARVQQLGNLTEAIIYVQMCCTAAWSFEEIVIFVQFLF